MQKIIAKQRGGRFGTALTASGYTRFSQVGFRGLEAIKSFLTYPLTRTPESNHHKMKWRAI
jgi:hypothetical protein